MTKKKHTNFARATIWTPTMRSDVEGDPDWVITMAFYALTTQGRRAKCIAELQAIDAKMTQHEQGETK